MYLAGVNLIDIILSSSSVSHCARSNVFCTVPLCKEQRLLHTPDDAGQRHVCAGRESECDWCLRDPYCFEQRSATPNEIYIYIYLIQIQRLEKRSFCLKQKWPPYIYIYIYIYIYPIYPIYIYIYIFKTQPYITHIYKKQT